MRNPVEVGEQLFTQRYRNWRRDLAVMAAGKRNKNPGKTADLPEEMPEKAGLEPRMVRFEPVMLMLRLRVGEGSSSPFNWGVASRPFNGGGGGGARSPLNWGRGNQLLKLGGGASSPFNWVGKGQAVISTGEGSSSPFNWGRVKQSFNWGGGNKSCNWRGKQSFNGGGKQSFNWKE